MTTTNPLSSTTFTAAVAGSVNSNSGTASYRSTEAQLEIWLSSQQSVEANCAYNEISSLEFKGDLNPSHLRTAIDSVFRRNASLRTTFSADGQTAIVGTEVRYDFEVSDWSDRDGADLDHALTGVIKKQGELPFDLVNGPLVRFVLQKISDDHHKLTFTAHHIVLDGWSLSVFCRDLGHFYDVAMGRQPKALPEPHQYDQYADAMQQYHDSDQRAADEAYWRDTFNDCIPVLDLPIQSRRPTLRTYRGRRHDHVFSDHLVKRIREISAKNGCSLFNGMLAAFSAFVSRISGADDFCIGIPTAGQSAMQTHELIGHCVNTMPLRTQVDGSLAFDEYMKRARSNFLTAYEHQRLSFGALLSLLAPPRDPSRPPLVSVSFNVDPVIEANEIGFAGLDVQVQVEPRRFENFEWFINGVIQKDNSVEMQVQYNADLYSAEAMQFYLEGFETFLTAIAQNPSRPISDYPVASIAQRQKMIVQWNDTEMAYPTDSTLHQEFARQAAMTPDRVAVEFEDTALTYAQVESRSNQIARFLRQNGVNQGDLVGICVERSEQMLVNLYGIMKAGAGYVPLDPAYPTDRLQYMCDHSGLSLIVTQSSLKARVAEFGKPQIEIDSNASSIDQLDSSPVANSVSPSDICYVIYTSGSTGKPKGVQVPHGPVVNFLYSMQREPGFGADDSLLAVTTLSFDIAVLELYLPTISGGRVVVLDSATAADGNKLIDQISTHNISLLQATPATWRLLIQSGWTGKSDLKVLCGGEPMPADLVGPLLQRCGELWNMYGPTETTVWSAVFQITDEHAPILIGKPIGNTQIYLLDSNGNEVPAGCEGELFIGGAGVTLGYRNRPDLTDERFIANPYRNPFADYVSDRIYKTGDIAQYRLDGNLEFLRRNDKQVKVRGFRIELGEIESNLKSHPAVQQNVVIVREDSPGDTRLAAYLVLKPGTQVSQAELRAHLRESVPPYMVPQNFVTLDAMPQTNNGKIDYKQLPKPSVDPSNESESSSGESPNSPAEIYMADIWKEVLEQDDVFVDDTFFDIGGHSLLVMQVIAKVHDATDIKLGPQDFLVNTLGQLAAKIQHAAVFLQDQSDANSPQAECRLTESKEAEPKELNQEHETQRAKSEASLKGFWD